MTRVQTNRSAAPISTTDDPEDIPFAAPPENGPWITDDAWICGAVGAFMVLAMALFYNATGALTKGVVIAGLQVTEFKTDSLLLALVVIAGAMLVTEMVRLWQRDKQHFFSIHPDLQKRRYLRFFSDAFVNWLLYLALLGVVMLFFRTAGEYGFRQNNDYYRVWFRLLDLVWSAYIWAGLPYVLVTRALKHDAVADRRDFSTLTARVLRFLISWLPGLKRFRPCFGELDRKATRALLVKLFFTPLMTVFFTDQFPHLVNNIGFVLGALPRVIFGEGYPHAQFNTDLFNISIAFIFSIDVALAWCGYVISSRWVDNQTVTAEPTMLGWLVCIACYPPFQRLLGLYYSAPGERAVLQFSNQWLITLFTVMMVLSYFVYMSATLWFGVRFSNLTNRGIIRKGPYAFIRHPAYASKNFAWWCVMFPAIVYNAMHTGLGTAVIQILGLIFMTWFYYLRAITEERHLGMDPYYQAYCRQVRYRFIPGVI
jgi:protein-S-isoprenylcysteine O-methyltransferase Ste14